MKFGLSWISGALVALAMLVTAATATAGNRSIATWTPHYKADRVVVIKSQRKLVLIRNGDVLRSYRVALGQNPMGHKIKEGDARTPEGAYTLDYRLEQSAFYKAIHISYPNQDDLQRAAFLGVPPGGRIMIHGQPVDRRPGAMNHPYVDWTQGCIAVTNAEIEEIWALVQDGTPIEIRP